jgi:polyhydroxyalkanoate synthase
MDDSTSKSAATSAALTAAGLKGLPRAPTAEAIDHAFRAAVGKLSGGLSTTAFAAAWTDWALQLAASPAQQSLMAADGLRRAHDWMNFAAKAASGEPLSPLADAGTDADKRFAADAWSQYPFNVWARGFQHTSAWLQALPANVEGLPTKSGELVEFTVRQWLEALSPTNYLATNPELIELTRREGGENLKRGAQHLLEDLARVADGRGPVGVENFEVGKAVAATPGKVVLQNGLMELLQYDPTTPDVYAEPILIVPAWIMKYYVLDLSARNSLVKYLVDQGHTVFMISWKNPGPEDRDYGMDDYLDLGPIAALKAIQAIVPDQKIHAAGYCIGGTLLSIAAAALARQSPDPLASVTLFAAQTDFSEPGELSLFINPSQLAMLKAQMNEEGVLDAKQMGGAFQMLRPRDLIWQPMIQSYVKGTRDPMIDLLAWNADGTRMPYRMHTEYLYRLYLDNELSTGRFPVHGEVVSLANITVPMFVVGTETDHVAPWKSVFKVGRLVRSNDYTFLLTSGGHNAGIVSGPVHPKRKHRVRSETPETVRLDAGDWFASVQPQNGSWWPVWQAWLASRSGERVLPPSMGNTATGYPVLGDAPGTYVHG